MVEVDFAATVRVDNRLIPPTKLPIPNKLARTAKTTYRLLVVLIACTSAFKESNRAVGQAIPEVFSGSPESSLKGSE
jgi:hypothetical protein